MAKPIPNWLRYFVFASALAAGLLAAVAKAETLRGVALVVGQSAYGKLAALPNPANDARDIASVLERLGFDAVMLTDRNAEQFVDDVDAFSKRAKGADVALVYYSGHGFEAGGDNFLVPVDADPDRLDATDGSLVRLSGLLDTLSEQAKVVILLVDACQTSPFPAGTKLITADNTQGEAIAAGGLGVPRGVTGLATQGSASLGEVIGFATEPGRVALDGDAGGNSPYAAALIKHFSAGERNFSDIMTMVAEEVYLKTRTRQRPWTNASLRRLLYFGGERENDDGDEALLRGARRQLLLKIAATPETTRTYVERLAVRDELPLDALYGMLAELQVDTSAGPARIDQQLRAGAANLKRFMAERRSVVSKDAELARLAGLADRAEADGAIGLAKQFRAQASARADELDTVLDKRQQNLSADRLELAAVYGDHAETAVLAFDFQLAADRYRDAFEQVGNWNDDQAFRYKLGEADALTKVGSFSGDGDVLQDAVLAYEDALELAPRRERPLDWAEAKNNLAGAYLLLSHLEEGVEPIHTALKFYQQALKQRPRAQVPVLWAKTQNNLGIALAQLGIRETGTGSLKKAVKAYRQALRVFTPEKEPAFFAIVQTNLGDVLRMLGTRGKGTRELQQSAEALLTALDIQTVDDDPFTWAASQNNLGNTYLFLGERTGDPTVLQLGLAAYEQALTIHTRDKMPFEWASTQSNIAGALKALGVLEEDEATLRQSIAAYEASLEERSFDQTPRNWGTAMLEMGKAYLEIGRLSGDHESIELGKGLVEETRDAFNSAGYAQYDAFFAEELKPFDEALSKLR